MFKLYCGDNTKISHWKPLFSERARAHTHTRSTWSNNKWKKKMMNTMIQCNGSEKRAKDELPQQTNEKRERKNTETEHTPIFINVHSTTILCPLQKWHTQWKWSMLRIWINSEMKNKLLCTNTKIVSGNIQATEQLTPIPTTEWQFNATHIFTDQARLRCNLLSHQLLSCSFFFVCTFTI